MSERKATKRRQPPRVLLSSYPMREAWTIINDETQEPILAMDSAGYPWLLYSSRRDAATGAKAHKELWEIDCHPARVTIAPHQPARRK